MIILPRRIYILSRVKDGKRLCGEYSLYYNNFIVTKESNTILEVRCEYGMDLGFCWRLTDTPKEVSGFELKFCLYDCCGMLLESAGTRIELIENESQVHLSLAVIGDSMTHTQSGLPTILPVWNL